MHSITPLAHLGRRIMVNGPSNSGKSTLADAISRKLDIPAIHLDRLSHEDYGNWIPREKNEFETLHDLAIANEAWIMDGNYSRLMPQRYARAIGIIVIDDHLLRRYRRYFYRSLMQTNRIGGLKSGRDSVKWSAGSGKRAVRESTKRSRAKPGYHWSYVAIMRTCELCMTLGTSLSEPKIAKYKTARPA